MTEIVLADKYAKALAACAQEADLVDQLDTELDMFRAILQKQARLPEILSSPIISLQEKRKLLKGVFQAGWLSPQLQSFFYLLVEKRRFSLFGQICKMYKALIYSLRKRLKVLVESASDLDAGQKRALKQKLHQASRRKVDLFVRLNPALIGGARIYVGQEVLDGTVNRSLTMLREKMLRD